VPAKRRPPQLVRLGVAQEQDELERFGETDMLELTGGGKSLDGCSGDRALGAAE